MSLDKWDLWTLLQGLSLFFFISKLRSVVSPFCQSLPFGRGQPFSKTRNDSGGKTSSPPQSAVFAAPFIVFLACAFPLDGMSVSFKSLTSDRIHLLFAGWRRKNSQRELAPLFLS